jgi:hypothetical protein
MPQAIGRDNILGRVDDLSVLVTHPLAACEAANAAIVTAILEVHALIVVGWPRNDWQTSTYPKVRKSIVTALKSPALRVSAAANRTDHNASPKGT